MGVSPPKYAGWKSRPKRPTKSSPSTRSTSRSSHVVNGFLIGPELIRGVRQKQLRQFEGRSRNACWQVRENGVHFYPGPNGIETHITSSINAMAASSLRSSRSAFPPIWGERVRKERSSWEQVSAQDWSSCRTRPETFGNPWTSRRRPWLRIMPDCSHCLNLRCWLLSS